MGMWEWIAFVVVSVIVIWMLYDIHAYNKAILINQDIHLSALKAIAEDLYVLREHNRTKNQIEFERTARQYGWNEKEDEL